MSGRFQERLDAVRRGVAAACERCGRSPDEVTILPVTKGFGPDAVREAADGGLSVMGESRVQEARMKIPLCPGHLRWHLIGHLQRNKAREAVELFETIHAVDSWRLLETIEGACEAAGRRLPAFIEVNVAAERSKYGLPCEAVGELLEQARAVRNVELAGLMTVPPFTPDPEEARPFFRRLRELRDALRDRLGFPIEGLSMGMSHDFEVAIEEGATCVRLGTALFGPRPAGAWKAQWATEGGDGH